MGILSALIWIGVGIFYIYYKSFLEITGHALFSILCIALCVVGILIPVLVLKETESSTMFFIAAGGLVELLALFVSQTKGNEGFHYSASIILSALIVLMGVLEMLEYQKWWLLSVIVPFAIYTISGFRIENKRHEDDNTPEKLKNQLSDEEARLLKSQLDNEFPTPEQARNVIIRHNLPHFYSQYTYEVYSIWREEELQGRIRNILADRNNKKNCGNM